MNDNQLYSFIEQKLNIATGVEIAGHFLPDKEPPYIYLYIDPLSTQYLPCSKMKANINIKIESRYNGQSEIKNIYQKIIQVLEGENLINDRLIQSSIKFENGQITLEKDGITRKAILNFTIMIFKS